MTLIQQSASLQQLRILRGTTVKNFHSQCDKYGRDGNYDNILSVLSFIYSDKSHDLSLPPNMHNSKGPTLRHDVGRKFATVIEWVAVVGGLKCNDSKLIPMNMLGER